MKSLAELQEIKDRTAASIALRRDGRNATRVIVGMATCGIAAGAREVVGAFMEEIAKNDLVHVAVLQTGCKGTCSLEPVVDVIIPGEEPVTYVKMTPEKAARVVKEHLAGNKVVTEYTIGAAE